MIRRDRSLGHASAPLCRAATATGASTALTFPCRLGLLTFRRCRYCQASPASPAAHAASSGHPCVLAQECCCGRPRASGPPPEARQADHIAGSHALRAHRSS